MTGPVCRSSLVYSSARISIFYADYVLSTMESLRLLLRRLRLGDAHAQASTRGVAVRRERRADDDARPAARRVVDATALAADGAASPVPQAPPSLFSRRKNLPVFFLSPLRCFLCRRARPLPQTERAVRGNSPRLASRSRRPNAREEARRLRLRPRRVQRARREAPGVKNDLSAVGVVPESAVPVLPRARRSSASSSRSADPCTRICNRRRWRTRARARGASGSRACARPRRHLQKSRARRGPGRRRRRVTGNETEAARGEAARRKRGLPPPRGSAGSAGRRASFVSRARSRAAASSGSSPPARRRRARRLRVAAVDVRSDRPGRRRRSALDQREVRALDLDRRWGAAPALPVGERSPHFSPKRFAPERVAAPRVSAAMRHPLASRSMRWTIRGAPRRSSSGRSRSRVSTSPRRFWSRDADPPSISIAIAMPPGTPRSRAPRGAC